MKPIKAGIIGFGRMASGHHLTKLRESGLYEVAGVCDITEARRKAAEKEGLRATADLDEFLSWDVEFVVIATHSSWHHEPAIRAAKAGKHVLVEKPIAASAQEAEEMAEAARRNQVMFAVYHNRHFDPDYCMVKSAVRDGLLGDLLVVESRNSSPKPAYTFGTPDFDQKWRITAKAGGGTLLDWGPHWIEQILDLMEGRKVVQVFGDVRHVHWGDAPDYFKIEIVFDNGARASVGRADIAFAWHPAKWLILGTKATLLGAVKEPDGQWVTIHGPDFQMRRNKAVETQDLYANFARHIREGEPLIIGAEHALRVMRVIQAGRDSAAAGKSLTVSI